MADLDMNQVIHAWKMVEKELRKASPTQAGQAPALLVLARGLGLPVSPQGRPRLAVTRVT